MSTSSTSTPTSGGTSVFTWVLGGLGVLLGLFLLVVGITTFFGAIVAEEFSPDTFTRRTYSYYQIPLTGIQVTQTSILAGTSDLETYLAAQNLIPTSANATPRWDLVQDHSSLSGEPVGAAYILTTYLDIRRPDDQIVWLQWSKDNTAQAKIFWPVIAELAREGWYHALPELFNFALGKRDAKAFQRELDDLLAERFFKEGELLRQQGKTAEARKCYDRTLKLAPKHAEAAKQRQGLPEEKAPSS